ncbi:MAG TPA: hypothetical protein VF559_03460 [Caulobacteraceae bacterium]|jgi:hypothetical protein
MFEMGRELKRLFGAAAPRDGLALGDGALLELLDLELLRREAGQSDIAAGRVSTRDRPMRRLESAAVWRELARRTGDAAALRKAASAAELAHRGFAEEGRADEAATAQVERARAAMLGAELFAEEGLNAAAGHVLTEAADASAPAQGGLAVIGARMTLASGGLDEALECASGFDIALRQLQGDEHRALRFERAEALVAFGARLHDPLLHKMALGDLEVAGHELDPAYRPLTWARVQELRAAALAGIGECHGDATPLAQAVNLLNEAAEQLSPEHSPLDWARVQNGLAAALMSLAEASGCESGYDEALERLDATMQLLAGGTHLALRAAVVQNRAGCLLRRAEALSDVRAIDRAEAAFRAELAALPRPVEPVAWAVLQLNLARVYTARAVLNGRDRGERLRASEALLAALDVFGEHGCRSLSVIGLNELERLREAAPRVAR